MATELSSAAVYTDIAGLSQLKRAAHADPNDSLREVAQQFESIFINTMLKSMRKASLGEGILSNSAVNMHTDMLDSQLALNMSQSNGLGLAEMLTRQLAPQLEDTSNSSINSSTNVSAVNDESAQPTAVLASKPQALLVSNVKTDEGMPQDKQVVVNNAGLKSLSQVARVYAEGDPYQQFVSEIWPQAKASAKQLGVSPELLVAQAVHETAWGRAIPGHDDGRSSHNLFGIKQGSAWQGKVTDCSTTEFVGGVAERQRAKFRGYDSYAESFNDYVSLISKSSRYQPAISAATQGGDEAYIQGLQDAGYATDPNYANRIITVMNGDRLREAVALSRSHEQSAISTQLVSKREGLGASQAGGKS